jgi:hypothetical protein
MPILIVIFMTIHTILALLTINLKRRMEQHILHKYQLAHNGIGRGKEILQ